MTLAWCRNAATAVLAATIAATGALAGTPDPAAPLRVDRLEVCECTSDGAPPTDALWKSIELPHRFEPGDDSELRTSWYRFVLTIEDPAEADLAVYLPKVSMNADLWIGDRLAARIGSMGDPITRHWNTPLLLRVPSVALHEGVNTLVIRVRAADRHNGGLAPFLIGPAGALESIAARSSFWRITFVNMLVAGMFALAFAVMMVWIRRPDRLEYLYFSLGAIGCAIASLNMTVSNPLMDDETWEVIAHIGLHGGVACLALFGWEFAQVGSSMKRRLMTGLVLLDLTALYLLEGTALRVAVSVFSLLIFTAALVAFVPLVRRLQQRPATDFLVFGIAAAFSIGIGAYDFLVVSGFMPYDAPYGLPYVWPVLLGAFAWLIAGDYARTQRELTLLNDELGLRVEAREKALLETHERLRAVERARVSAEERSRVLRDMHDGVGSHLATALRQLESGRSSNGDVASTLRDSLDYLKLSIDAMTVNAGDVNALLAALRYRLAPRLDSAGLQVLWQVEELPIWETDGDEESIRHLQYLLFELLSNIVQHARASRISVDAAVVDDAIEIGITDDGCGVPPGVELKSSTQRASSLGARLDVQTGAWGTCVRIRLPRSRASA